MSLGVRECYLPGGVGEDDWCTSYGEGVVHGVLADVGEVNHPKKRLLNGKRSSAVGDEDIHSNSIHLSNHGFASCGESSMDALISLPNISRV